MDKRSFLFVIALTIALFFVNQWFAPTPAPQITTAKPSVVDVVVESPSEFIPSPSTTPPSGKEEFFVLENAYQQIVFSNKGGAIAEINLPFTSGRDTLSPVLPTDLDRTFQARYPLNDYFPSFAYSINTGSGVKKMDERTLGGYYPLLRRTLFSSPTSWRSPSRSYALRISSPGQEIDDKFFSLSKLEKDRIEFSYSDGKRRITKSFAFSGVAPYCLEVAIKIDGDATGLWLTSGVPEVELISDSPAPALTYKMTKGNQKTAVESLSLPKECITTTGIRPNWVCSSNGFFALIVDPITEVPAGYRACKVPGTEDPTRLTLVDPQYDLYPAEKYPGYEFQLPLGPETTQLRYYAGPLQTDLLTQVDQAYTNPVTRDNPQYILALSYHGWLTFISEPFAKFLFILMNFFHTITSSWGVAIILLTVILRIMLYPLNAWSIKSTLKMQGVAPRVTALQEKYKKDPKRAQVEIMGLYKEHGVNPLSGCFPLLIQIPFLIGMFDLLKSVFELRGVSFIPGWIDNLTAPDILFSWDYPILFFGTSFHLLPFLLGAVMWAQQRFSSSTPTDAKKLTDQQRQQRMMGNIMTVVFTVMFYHFPSGLNLYWLSSMALGIGQQWWMTRRMVKR